MATFTMRIEMNNAAFADWGMIELERVIEEDLLPKIRENRAGGILRDANGNTVGEFQTVMREG